jgi:hypothetical protein
MILIYVKSIFVSVDEAELLQALSATVHKMCQKLLSQ